MKRYLFSHVGSQLDVESRLLCFADNPEAVQQPEQPADGPKSQDDQLENATSKEVAKAADEKIADADADLSKVKEQADHAAGRIVDLEAKEGHVEEKDKQTKETIPDTGLPSQVKEIFDGHSDQYKKIEEGFNSLDPDIKRMAAAAFENFKEITGVELNIENAGQAIDFAVEFSQFTPDQREAMFAIATEAPSVTGLALDAALKEKFPDDSDSDNRQKLKEYMTKERLDGFRKLQESYDAGQKSEPTNEKKPNTMLTDEEKKAIVQKGREMILNTGTYNPPTDPVKLEAYNNQILGKLQIAGLNVDNFNAEDLKKPLTESLDKLTACDGTPFARGINKLMGFVRFFSSIMGGVKDQLDIATGKKKKTETVEASNAPNTENKQPPEKAAENSSDLHPDLKKFVNRTNNADASVELDAHQEYQKRFAGKPLNEVESTLLNEVEAYEKFRTEKETSEQKDREALDKKIDDFVKQNPNDPARSAKVEAIKNDHHDNVIMKNHAEVTAKTTQMYGVDNLYTAGAKYRVMLLDLAAAKAAANPQSQEKDNGDAASRQEAQNSKQEVTEFSPVETKTAREMIVKMFGKPGAKENMLLENAIFVTPAESGKFRVTVDTKVLSNALKDVGRPIPETVIRSINKLLTTTDSMKPSQSFNLEGMTAPELQDFMKRFEKEAALPKEEPPNIEGPVMQL